MQSAGKVARKMGTSAKPKNLGQAGKVKASKKARPAGMGSVHRKGPC